MSSLHWCFPQTISIASTLLPSIPTDSLYHTQHSLFVSYFRPGILHLSSFLLSIFSVSPRSVSLLIIWTHLIIPLNLIRCAWRVADMQSQGCFRVRIANLYTTWIRPWSCTDPYLTQVQSRVRCPGEHLSANSSSLLTVKLTVKSGLLEEIPTLSHVR